MDQQSKSFSYAYSAQQQQEVRRIRQQYLPPEEDKMERLRKLDAHAARPGKIAALSMGVAGALVFGVGMCCTMVWTAYFIPGIAIGLLGMASAAAAYPVSRIVTKRMRKKLAPQILALSKELLDP